MNLCKDCSHFRPQISIVGGEPVHHDHACCHVEREPVYGAWQTCMNARTRSGTCGPDGANLEKRPDNAKNFEMVLWVSQDRTGAVAVEPAAP